MIVPDSCRVKKLCDKRLQTVESWLKTHDINSLKDPSNYVPDSEDFAVNDVGNLPKVELMGEAQRYQAELDAQEEQPAHEK